MEICHRSFEKKWNTLRLFEKKILIGLGRHVHLSDANTKAYRLHLTAFGLDLLNPTDITERLRGLKKKSVQVKIDRVDPVDRGTVFVPLITDVQYDDPSKTVVLTFNSILKEIYMLLGRHGHYEKGYPLKNNDK
jgi:hypothetical protein